jgi:nicotinamidase-related amidase
MRPVTAGSGSAGIAAATGKLVSSRSDCKTRYSAFAEPQLLAHLQERAADGLIITGSETDVWVLATILGAVTSATV